MNSLFYSTVPGKLRTFIEAIPTTGVPSKVTNTELAARGFKSSNDRTIVPILRAVGLIDASGTPTESWQAFRNRATNKALMASLVRAAYADLFVTYPDADKRSDAEIKNFFSTRSKAGERALQYGLATFRALASLADFASDHSPMGADHAHLSTGQASRRGSQVNAPLQPNLTINVGIQIPDQADAEMIDQIFKSMAIHLYGKSEE